MKGALKIKAPFALEHNNEKLRPIEIKKGISPSNPDKHFEVLKKYTDNVATGLVVCMSNKLQPINKKCWLVPIEYI